MCKSKYKMTTFWQKKREHKQKWKIEKDMNQ